jgi:Cu(I)/Ag(I) efflux system membrane fusion protein
MNALWVEAQVYLPYIHYLSVGTEALISIPAAGDKEFTGKVIFINPQVESSSRFVLARFQILNNNEDLKPGILANIRLSTDKKKALTLPLDAIILESEGASVWIRNKEGIFENRMISIGMQNSREAEILSGINEGDLVVVSGAYLLNSEYIFKKGANPMESHGMMPGMKM